MMWKSSILVVLVAIVCDAQRTPSISYITQEQIKDIGGTVELDCSVQYAQEYTVLWVKNSRERGDNVFLSTGSSLVIRDSRFALRYDPSSSTYTLQIKDIQETDAGTYQCQVILSVNNKIAADVLLSVRRPPVISDNSTQSLVVSEGKPVQMECYAGGYPHPTITWRRENNAILPTGMYSSQFAHPQKLVDRQNRTISSQSHRTRAICYFIVQKCVLIRIYWIQFEFLMNKISRAIEDLNLEKCTNTHTQANFIM